MAVHGNNFPRKYHDRKESAFSGDPEVVAAGYKVFWHSMWQSGTSAKTHKGRVEYTIKAEVCTLAQVWVRTPVLPTNFWGWIYPRRNCMILLHSGALQLRLKLWTKSPLLASLFWQSLAVAYANQGFFCTSVPASARNARRWLGLPLPLYTVATLNTGPR